MQLPAPDYSTHPDYQFGPITLAQRLEALGCIGPHLAQAQQMLGAVDLLPDYDRPSGFARSAQGFLKDGAQAFDVQPSNRLIDLCAPLLQAARETKLAKDVRDRKFEDCIQTWTPEQQPEIAGLIEQMLVGAPGDLLRELYQGAWRIEIIMLHNNDESDLWVWSYPMRASMKRRRCSITSTRP